MSPAEFVQAWLAGASEYDEGLVTAAPEALATVDIPESAKTFLTEAGLPDAAAPYLSFQELQNERLLTLAAAHDRAHDEAAHTVYCIGGNGSGDPIGVNAAGQVWVFNHDADFDRTFVNSSVAQLAACLLAYRQLVADIVRGTGSYLSTAVEGKVPAELVNNFLVRLQEIDPDAYASIRDERGGFLHSMWQYELRAMSRKAQ
jgi:hypothetical protein